MAGGKFPFGPTRGPQAIPMQPPIFRDRIGRPLHLGDEILPDTPMSLIVTKVEPALAPNAPPNHILVMLQAQVMMMLPANVPITQFIRIQTAAERGIVAAAQNNGQPPAEGEPTDPLADQEAADAGRTADKKTIISTE